MGDDAMRELFFDEAEASKRANGVMVIVLQSKPKARGGKPEPIKILSCRTAGALALIDAIKRALRER